MLIGSIHLVVLPMLLPNQEDVAPWQSTTTPKLTCQIVATAITHVSTVNYPTRVAQTSPCDASTKGTGSDFIS